MKRFFLVNACSLLSIVLFAQTNFEPGYFVNNNGNKTECLIKNLDWKDSPESFEYKLNETGKTVRAGIDSIREFGIDEKTIYRKYTVSIDQSSVILSDLSKIRSPEFQNDTKFLKVLIEGEASLYSYLEGNLKRYFFQMQADTLIPLVYKKYREGSAILENEQFKQQLWNKLKCEKIEQKDLRHLNYHQKNLIDIFTDYNECKGKSIKVYLPEKERDLFNLYLRPGLNYSSLETANLYANERAGHFGNALTFRMGIESEFILPFNNNKWAAFLEPTYQYYKAEKKFERTTGSIDYSSIEIPFGIRYYYFFNEKSKVFINSAIVLDLHGETYVDYTEPYQDLTVKSKFNYAFGAGFNYMNKFTTELRYYTNRELFINYPLWKSEYKTISLILGYAIF